jgi:CRP/FNR family cyclic AMP-dependent transcriptional regulator
MRVVANPKIEATLRNTQLFAPLSGAELQSVAARAALKTYSPGELLFSEGEPCTGFYVVVTGRVRIFKSSRSGREQVLSIEGPGQSIAELPVFDGGVYPASVLALDLSELVFVSRADFRAVCLEHPEVSLKLLQVVGGRLRRLVGIIEELSFTTLRQRLISWLLRQAQAEGRPGPRGVSFDIGITHQELAAQIGTVRELVSRNMARLQSQGFIEMNGRQITITDQAGLEADLSSEV